MRGSILPGEKRRSRKGNVFFSEKRTCLFFFFLFFLALPCPLFGFFFFPLILHLSLAAFVLFFARWMKLGRPPRRSQREGGREEEELAANDRGSALARGMPSVNRACVELSWRGILRPRLLARA